MATFLLFCILVLVIIVFGCPALCMGVTFSFENGIVNFLINRNELHLLFEMVKKLYL
jgi:hypothetical protein